MNQRLKNELKKDFQFWLKKWMKRKKCEDLLKVTLSVASQPKVSVELALEESRPVRETDLEPRAKGPWARKYAFVRPATLNSTDWDEVLNHFTDEKIPDSRYQVKSVRKLIGLLQESDNQPVKRFPAPQECNPSDAMWMFNRIMKQLDWREPGHHLFITDQHFFVQVWVIKDVAS